MDGTDCPIARPSQREDRDNFSSGRKKENQYSRYNIKYTLVVQVTNGRICGVLGPHPGSLNDVTALQHSGMLEYLKAHVPMEVVLADRGYQGENGCLTPFKRGSGGLRPDEEAFNEVLASVRQLVECVLKRVKDFGVLGKEGRWRGSLERHAVCFNVVCNIVNISMTRDPVWLKTNWYLKHNA